jgi:LemA protein
MTISVVYVLAGIAAAAVTFVSVAYNTLITLRQRCAQAYADIDVQMKRRADLIGTLTEVVKAHAGHERTTQEGVAAARRVLEGANRSGINASRDCDVAQVLTRLLVVIEAYPELKAPSSFAMLMANLADTERRISNARRYLNNSAAEYNTALEQFPGLVFYAGFNLTPIAFHDLGTDGRLAAVIAPVVQIHQR